MPKTIEEIESEIQVLSGLLGIKEVSSPTDDPFWEWEYYVRDPETGISTSYGKRGPKNQNLEESGTYYFTKIKYTKGHTSEYIADVDTDDPNVLMEYLNDR